MRGVPRRQIRQVAVSRCAPTNERKLADTLSRCAPTTKRKLADELSEEPPQPPNENWLTHRVDTGSTHAAVSRGPTAHAHGGMWRSISAILNAGGDRLHENWVPAVRTRHSGCRDVPERIRLTSGGQASHDHECRQCNTKRTPLVHRKKLVYRRYSRWSTWEVILARAFHDGTCCQDYVGSWRSRAMPYLHLASFRQC